MVSPAKSSDGVSPTARPGVEEIRARLGFRDGDRGTHSSRTLMFRELELLLDATPADASLLEYRQAVVEDNVLGKRTHTTREHTTRKLKALFGLDPALPVFRAMRRLWEVDAEGRPLLALLCGFARDPLLQMTADLVLDAEVGTEITPEDLEELLRRKAPGRFSETSERSIARNVLSSWTQSGHLTGHQRKTRARATATPGNTAYALFLGYLEGRRAQRLFASTWARLLDAPEERLLDFTRAASRRAWLDFRSVGSVIEVRFPDLLSAEEEELLHE